MQNSFTPLWFWWNGGKYVTFMGLKPEDIGSLFVNPLVCRHVIIISRLKNVREAEAWLTYIRLSCSARLLIGWRKMQKLNHSQWKNECWAHEKDTWTHHSFKKGKTNTQTNPKLISEEQQRRLGRASRKYDTVGQEGTLNKDTEALGFLKRILVSWVVHLFMELGDSSAVFKAKEAGV